MHGNLAAKTMFKVARVQHRAGGFWSIEHPRDSYMWDLPGARQIARWPGVRRIVGDQCCFGAASVKPTAWLTNGTFVEIMQQKCPGQPDHPRHEPLVGMVKVPGGKWVSRTSLAAAYPRELCEVVAKEFKEWASEDFRPAPPIRISGKL